MTCYKQKILRSKLISMKTTVAKLLLLITLVFSSSHLVVAQQKALKAEDDPRILKQIREFLKGLNAGTGKPMEELSYADARAVLVDAQKSVNVDYSGIEESEKTITQDGQAVKIHITKPTGAKSNSPCFIFIHGGGWVLGDYPTHRRLVRDLVVQSGAVAIFPDYTPSPEANYPTAINEIYAAAIWVANNGYEIGVDGKNMAIVGNSVGGNMTAAVTLMAKERNDPMFKLQVMLWPVTDASFETSSYNELAEGRFLTKKMMIWFWDTYLPEVFNRRHEIFASPLQASLEQLKDLPPALIQTAENDVLRDEGEAYARKLDEAGVPVTLTRYNGLIHDYGLLNPIADVPAIRVAIFQAAATIKDALRVQSPTTARRMEYCNPD
jgi:acetyl esterase/lipase